MIVCVTELLQILSSGCKMPNYLFHRCFCPCVYLSICGAVYLERDLWSRASVRLCFLFLLVYGDQVPPRCQTALFSSADVRGTAIPFIIPSKLSLFPSLSFIISTVSSETDCRSLPISLCLSAPVAASRRANVQGEGTGPISYAALCPHVEMCHS